MLQEKRSGSVSHPDQIRVLDAAIEAQRAAIARIEVRPILQVVFFSSWPEPRALRAYHP